MSLSRRSMMKGDGRQQVWERRLERRRVKEKSKKKYEAVVIFLIF